MLTMTAVAWIGVMFLVAAILRAKVSFLGKMLVPSCVIAGVIGFILMNTIGLGDTTSAEYTTISGQLYTFMFINLGITLAAKTTEKKSKEKIHTLKDMRTRMGDSMFSGIFGMGSFWAMAYAFQALVGFGVLVLIGKIWDMDPTYGLLIPFGFAQGPGQAVAYGTEMEAAGWANAIQVGITFAAVGFLIAFLFGVPYAKRGIQKGIACSRVKMGDDLAKGFVEPEKQETYGKVTTYGGNLDVMTFHIALVGICWVLGIYVGKLWGFFPAISENSSPACCSSTVCWLPMFCATSSANSVLINIWIAERRFVSPTPAPT